MRAPCELCHHETLTQVYEPERSPRGLKIYLCNHCGLVQSLPRIDRAPRKSAAVSGGADWGNVRYGKGFRTRQALDAIAAHADLSAPLALLDVGSNRGSFARAFLDVAPAAHLTALEPDERFAASCADLPRTMLVQARTELQRGCIRLRRAAPQLNPNAKQLGDDAKARIAAVRIVNLIGPAAHHDLANRSVQLRQQRFDLHYIASRSRKH